MIACLRVAITNPAQANRALLLSFFTREFNRLITGDALFMIHFTAFEDTVFGVLLDPGHKV